MSKSVPKNINNIKFNKLMHMYLFIIIIIIIIYFFGWGEDNWRGILADGHQSIVQKKNVYLN